MAAATSSENNLFLLKVTVDMIGAKPTPKSSNVELPCLVRKQTKLNKMTYVGRHIDDKFSDRLGFGSEENLHQFFELSVMPRPDSVV